MTEPQSDLAWMRLQASTLYSDDERGRILAARVPGGDDAAVPRLFVGITPEGLLWRLRADLSPSLVRELSRLLGAERAPGSLDALPERMATLRERLAESAAIEREWIGASYRFPQALREAQDAAAITASEADRAREFSSLAGRLDARLPAFGVVESGRIVSLAWCATARGSPGQGVEAGVETLPGFRGRGLAPRVLSAWARAIREGGETPLYRAGRADRASRSVARKLGLEQFGTVLLVG